MQDVSNNLIENKLIQLKYRVTVFIASTTISNFRIYRGSSSTSIHLVQFKILLVINTLQFTCRILCK